VTLGALARACDGTLSGDSSTVVTDVVSDSSRIIAGALFVAIRGATADGHDFVAHAKSEGAVAALVERPLDVDIAQIVVDDTRRAMGPVAAECWGHPDRRVQLVGVTGTNGKTTVVGLIADVMTASGSPTVAMGTLTGIRTTPEATDLIPDIAAAVDDGAEVVAIEVSSHALSLHRVDGLQFDLGVFTNLGDDHLDFHGTSEQYFAAKATLFEPGRTDIALVNVDDTHGRLLRDAAPPPPPEIVEYSVDAVTELELSPDHTTFTWRGQPVDVPLAGRFNVSNVVAAAEACAILGAADVDIARALSAVTPPPGRFELVDRGQPFVVVVDYAHTAEGLAEVLVAARDLTAGRVIVAFGCGGDRDHSKRPRMGARADELADLVIITSDNPRSEDPSTIMAEVATGCDRLTPRLEIDRAKAISLAIDEASPGDVVVIAGKGHETTQTTRGSVTPFDDRVVAGEVLAELVAEVAE
jgi:UDP-N-acetylmuramoyl-L-alanyl-D-glutamate--2,6-diaminopimelate ligase